MNAYAGLNIEAGLAHLRAVDPVLAALAAHQPLSPPAYRGSLFQSLVRSIIGQQVSSNAAAAIMRRLSDTVAGGGALVPDHILAAGYEGLRAAGLSGAKTRYVFGLAEAVNGGTVVLDQLHELSEADVIARLTQLKGIGQWTAEMFLLFSLERPDVLAVGDLGIRSAVMRHYGLPTVPSADELRTIAAPWHPYCSTASLLLWRSLGNTPVAQPQATMASPA